MSVLTDLMVEDRRFLVLRLCAEVPDLSLDTPLLAAAISQLTYACSIDQAETAAGWLQEQGLVDLRKMPGGNSLVTLTDRGVDIANGRAIVSGVRRPRRGELVNGAR